MPRAQRIVIPGYPHHVVQKGVQSLPVFQSDEDRRQYIWLMRAAADQHGVSFWAWCLMTNHSHFIAIPAAESSLSLMMRDAHREYARRRNRERSLRGHLFQERFYSYPVQADAHLLAVARYIELNPTGAGLASSPPDYQWSSARYHCSGCADPLVQGSPLRAMVPDWRLLLQDGQQIVNDNIAFEKHLKAGRPLGDDAWLGDLSARTGRRFPSSQRGRRRRS